MKMETHMLDPSKRGENSSFDRNANTSTNTNTKGVLKKEQLKRLLMPIHTSAKKFKAFL